MKLTKMITVAAGLLFGFVHPSHACCSDAECPGSSPCGYCSGFVYILTCWQEGTCVKKSAVRCCVNMRLGICDPDTGNCDIIGRRLLEEAGLAPRSLQDDEEQCSCPEGTDTCGEPHLQGLMGQRIDWSGIDGGWYSLVKDDHADLRVNVRVSAPLPEEFPDRQLITAVSILSWGHSLVIEVKDPYSIDTEACPPGVFPCLSNGGLRATVDGEEVDSLAGFSRDLIVADGIEVSAANLPAECRQFGGDRIWAETYDKMLHSRKLTAVESFEEWILRFKSMAAPDWCVEYVSEHDVADVQSIHSVFRIVTASNVVRLNVGVNYQTAGEVDGAGRVLPDLEFWQMDVGIQGLSLDEVSLSGLLGETARLVLDEDGREIMDGYDAFRGTIEDYRVSGPLGTDFALLTNKE